MMSVDMQKAVIGFANVCLGDALETTLKELAKFHDNKSGPWLDELERRFVDRARHSHTDDVSPEDEAKIIAGGIGMIEFYFAAARRALGE